LIAEILAASDYNVAGKTAIVTGVSRRRGIGAAVALALARAGVNLFITYYRPFDALAYKQNDPKEATAILDAIRAPGVAVAHMEADLADSSTPSMLFDAAEKHVGKVDVLINNAAYDLSANIYSLTADALDRHYAVNVRGTTLLCAEFARRHNGREGGRIINFTSGQGLHPMPESLPYAITKGAIEALTISLSATLIKNGITVNAIDPGGTNTGWMSDELLAELTAKSPAGRVSLPEDAARLILFLVSSQAGWITGQIIRSRGGN
jgi:3-oxoacyl-[acyl-carrier protein] reductase